MAQGQNKRRDNSLYESRIILGVNCAYHESSAAVVVEGRVVSAVEEERFSGRKHGKQPSTDNPHHLPFKAIEFCMQRAGIIWQDVDAIGYSLDPELRKQQVCLGTEGSPNDFGHPVGEEIFQCNLSRLPALFGDLTSAPLFFVPHHFCHAWYAMGTSPFNTAAVLVMDGIGEGASVSLGRADRKNIIFYTQTLFPSSLGLAWEKVARFLGFTEYDACKVMALAGLNRQSADNTFYGKNLYWEDSRLVVNQDLFDLEHPADYSGLEQFFQCSRQDLKNDNSLSVRIAATMQLATERVLVDIVRDLYSRSGEKNLVYGGGVALNCRANLEIAEKSPFSSLHIGPATHDAGTAVGAAWFIYTSTTSLPLPKLDTNEVAGIGPSPGIAGLHVQNWELKGSLPDIVQMLVQGDTIGWIEGACEFGPRALGRRSLLAAPLSEDAVSRLNTLKGRFWFEPLAVSVTSERADELFDIPPSGHGLTPYMLMTVRPRSAWRDKLSHLIHADGTVRMQTVQEGNHPLFHALLAQIEQKTGLPLLLNTSFNPRGLPMPATMDQAFSLAEKLGISHISIGGILWRKKTKVKSEVVEQVKMNKTLLTAGCNGF